MVRGEPAQHDEREYAHQQGDAGQHVERQLLPGDVFHAQARKESELAFRVVAQYPLIPLIGQRVEIEAQREQERRLRARQQRQVDIARQGCIQAALYSFR